MSDMSIVSTLQVCHLFLGRAGSGKTYTFLRSIAEQIQQSPRGVQLIFLTPEQASAQMERRLATWPGLRGGTTRCRVFSFHHLAREAFLRGGGSPGRQLGDVGRVLLLRQAMRRRQDALAALGQSATQPGVAETLSQTLLEFQRYGWSRADLEAWLAAEAMQNGEQSLTVRKVRDLTLLWRDYEEALAAGGWEDPAHTFELAAAAIRKARWLEGCRIWVDGFSSFTAQEMKIMEALLEKAEQANFALCLDPARL
jgi:ATP-dependent helicase/nuclease subunit B